MDTILGADHRVVEMVDGFAMTGGMQPERSPEAAGLLSSGLKRLRELHHRSRLSAGSFAFDCTCRCSLHLCHFTVGSHPSGLRCRRRRGFRLGTQASLCDSSRDSIEDRPETGAQGCQTRRIHSQQVCQCLEIQAAAPIGRVFVSLEQVHETRTNSAHLLKSRTGASLRSQ